MIINTITTIPVILMIIEIMHDQQANTSKLVDCADDFTVAGTLTELKVLWNVLCDLVPKSGYYTRASKS